ncbi:DNA-3-methyladenine glycosylase family protein [Aquirhabdus parva]|uniref:DNA-3-methyladenine glycosylase II n=1 Tax=Aquirhabdus parva TaxID=2283318 RepID=A0A345P967_9GAMM|nr:DNA-3-methyladenine glycosylase [Aquirhabdus parva]AXI03826.1 DNA-3-methyladenine glycosylase 2 family protein [Aquirhabdus parva]
MYPTFTSANFQILCDELAVRDADLGHIIHTHGYPPMWTRNNSFETLVHIILEQQVSLASALAALNQLRARIGIVTPERVLTLSDEELKACYFSRQKTAYVRGLAEALMTKQLDLIALETLPNDEVRRILCGLKGIGDWTADVYLMFVLRRTDLFPLGDLAAVNALKTIKGLPKVTPRETLLTITQDWQPSRTIAAMILWHYYLSVRKKA